jgi:hypothetical protein
LAAGCARLSRRAQAAAARVLTCGVGARRRRWQLERKRHHAALAALGGCAQLMRADVLALFHLQQLVKLLDHVSARAVRLSNLECKANRPQLDERAGAAARQRRYNP